MMSTYDTPFQDLQAQIFEFSPRSAELLSHLQAQCGSRLAYYAAFILICLQTKAEESGYLVVQELDPRNLESFMFFEYARDNPAAISLFNEILDSYRSDQASR